MMTTEEDTRADHDSSSSSTTKTSSGLHHEIPRYLTMVFALMNLSCGIPIAFGLISARSFVPIIMSNFDVCNYGNSNSNNQDIGPGTRTATSGGGGGDGGGGGPPERLYNIVFGLLATLLGLLRLVLTQRCHYYRHEVIRRILIISYAIEFLRDVIMMMEGYISRSEAVALLPSLVLMAAIQIANCHDLRHETIQKLAMRRANQRRRTTQQREEEETKED